MTKISVPSYTKLHGSTAALHSANYVTVTYILASQEYRSTWLDSKCKDRASALCGLSFSLASKHVKLKFTAC